MSNTQIIDMSKLPAPDVVVVPQFETILSALKADLLAAMPADLRPDVSDTLALESEPLTKWLERLAYQLMVERSDRNDSAHAVMLAYARGADLDQVAALFGVQRLVLTPANPAAVPPVETVMEDDETFRARIQLAPKSFSVAGPTGAYVFHAKSADGQVLDVSATCPEPGTVLISVLARYGDGTPDQALLGKVMAAVSADDVRPLSDRVLVKAAQILPYEIRATVYTLPGPDSSSVLLAARQRTQAYAALMHMMGRAPTLSGIYAAMHIEGVHRVQLHSPAADMAVLETQASWCTVIDIQHGDNP